VSIAADADGRFLAITCEQVENVGAYPFPGNGSTAGAGMMIFPGPYRIPRMDYVAHAVYTNTCGRCAYRGPWMMETVGREQAVDLAARRLGMDPLELRRRNVIAQPSSRIKARGASSTTASARPRLWSKPPS
jgi:aerobic carbon-monoxide dehydrogenase large subunit